MSKDRSISDSLVLDDSGHGVVISGITDDKVAAKSGLQAGDEIVAATIHLDHLNKNDVMKILKVLEPYDDNMKVLTKKELGTSADLGSLGLDLKDPSEMFNLKKKDLSLNASADAPAMSLNGPNINADPKISGPSLNGDLPNLSLNKPSADAGADFTLPSLGLTKPDVKGDLDGTIKAPDVSVSTPKLNTPSASVDVEKPKGKLKYDPPKFTMPHFNMSKPKTPTANADISGDVDVPNVNVNADPELSSGKINWPWKKNVHVNKPDTNVSAPDVDFSVPKVEGDINGPNVNASLPEVDMKTPNVEAPSGKMNWHHLDWWKSKFQGPKANLDMDADVNTPNLNLSTPKIEGDINAPNADLNLPKAEINGPGIDIQKPDADGKINWPHLKWKKPKFHGPKADMDLNADVNTPNVDVSVPKIDGDISAPKADLDLKAPEANIEAPSGKMKFPTLKKPKFTFGNAKTPQVDVDTPNVDINAPNADVEVPSGKNKWPTFRKPKWAVSGPNVNGPDVDVDADLSGPKIDADLKAPKADLEGPKIDVNAPDVGGPSGKFKGFTLPKFGTLKSPKADIDTDLNAPKIEGGIEAPDLNTDVKGPKVDLDSPDGKLKFPKLKLPKFKGPKVKGPDLDTDLEAPDIDASLDIPKVDVDTPNVGLKTPDASLSTPKIEGGIDADLDKNFSGKFKMPKLNIGGPKAKVPDAEIKAPDLPDASIQLPAADLKAPNINASAPTIKGDLSSPNLDLDGGLNTDLKLKTPKSNFNLPSVDAKGPSLDVKGPDAQVNTPDLDFDSSVGDFKLPHFNLPTLGLSDPAVNVPSVKSGLESPKVNLTTPSADADISGPGLNVSAPKVEGDIAAPKLDVKTPEVDANLEKSKMPHFKLPKLNFSGSKVKSPELDTSADLEVPSVKGEISSPDVNVSGPEGGISVNKPNLEMTADDDSEVKGSRLKWPFSWGRKSGTDDEGSGVDAEVSAPNADVDLPAFKFHNLPRPSIDGTEGNGDTFSLSKLDTTAKDYVVSKGVRLPILNSTSKPGEKIDILQRLKMAKEKVPSANASPTEAKSSIDLNLSAPSLDVDSSSDGADASLVRGGTFKVEKPALAVSPSDENEKLSLGLSKMLGLN